MVDRMTLTRRLLESGRLDELALQGAPSLRLLSEGQRQASLNTTLARRPDGDVWLFAYGSLIWNPTVCFEERRISVVEGWHRSFCLSVLMGRGTPDEPGVTLGLDRSGSCSGVIYRLPEAKLKAELSLLWRREMLTGSYIPRWIEVSDKRGSVLGSALAFTIDREGPQYAGELARDVIVSRLATASGFLGSAAEYLFQTCHELRDHGFPDEELETLAKEVAEIQAAEPMQRGTLASS